MASSGEIISFCDELLDVRSFSDYGPNGLQVPGRADVGAIATGVSANLEFLSGAVDGGAELVIVHHGLIWGGSGEALSPVLAGRLRVLLASDVGLAAYHLPLDAHPEVGNNAILCERLDLELDPRPFAEAKGKAIGAIGHASEPVGIGELESRLAAATGADPLVFDSGPDRITDVGIISGAGSFAIEEAGALGLDALVTGEPNERAMGEARERGIHFLAAGHYATETFGVRRLGELIAERFGLAHDFVDVPNPV